MQMQDGGSGLTGFLRFLPYQSNKAGELIITSICRVEPRLQNLFHCFPVDLILLVLSHTPAV